jgi:hypothetical protein
MRIRTFVIAVGADAQGLDAIALSGGTSHAYSTRPLDFDELLVRIGRARLICDIPTKMTSYQAEHVQVRWRLESSTPFVRMNRVAELASCGSNGGWFFESPAVPNLMVVCPLSCAALVDAPAGQLVAGFDCEFDGGRPPM